ncbi:MAG: DUF1295 domain-containing protein [Hyphomonadaceae bacterium]
MTEALPILLTNLIVTGICFAVLWLISIPLKDPSYIDSWWALGVVVLAWSTFVQLTDPGPHATALLFLASAWGLRLGVYLFWRWANHGKDRRYAKLAERAKQKHGLNFAMFSVLWVFAPQLVLQFIMSLPAQLGQIPETTNFGALAMSAFGSPSPASSSKPSPTRSSRTSSRLRPTKARSWTKASGATHATPIISATWLRGGACG